MIKRYSSRKIFDNEEEAYQDIFRERNVKFITQYDTSTFYRPSAEEYAYIDTVKHTWSIGDRYYKLANFYYGDARDWWVIAKFNNRPTEAHNKLGDILLIPTRIEEVKSMFRM